MSKTRTLLVILSAVCTVSYGMWTTVNILPAIIKLLIIQTTASVSMAIFLALISITIYIVIVLLPTVRLLILKTSQQ